MLVETKEMKLLFLLRYQYSSILAAPAYGVDVFNLVRVYGFAFLIWFSWYAVTAENRSYKSGVSNN